MKRFKIHYFTSKIFKRYFYSYLSTVLILMSILSLLELRHFSRKVKAEEVRTTQMRIDEVLEGLDVQTDYMVDIVSRLANSKEFSKEYINENKYHEIEMLDSLDNYHNTSEIIKEYFLIYPEDKYIFTSEGNRSLLSAYMSGKMSKEEVENLQDSIGTLLDNEYKMVLYSIGDITIYMFPMNRYVYSEMRSNGIFCFMVYEEDIRNYMERYGVFLEDNVIVKCGETTLFSRNGNEGDIYLEGSSDKYDYTIQGWMDEDKYFKWSNIFGMDEILVFGLSVVFLFFAAAIIAYWNYLPFCKIVDRYSSFSGKTLIKDFKGIEMMLEELIEDKANDKKVIQEQYRVIKEQLIGSIAKGGYANRLEKYLVILNIQLNGPYFGALRCMFLDSVSGEMYKSMRHEVEMLADENALYGIFNDGEEYVFVSAQEENQINHAAIVIREFLQSKNIDCEPEVIYCCKDMTNIKDALLIAERKLKAEDAMEEQQEEKKSALVVHALAYIEAHVTDPDLCLDKVAEELKVTTQYLSGVIKQQTGKNYKKIVTDARFGMAKKLLIETDLNVSIISWKCGYNDVSYFIKAFQKHTGVTPAKYREMNQHGGLQ